MMKNIRTLAAAATALAVLLTQTPAFAAPAPGTILHGTMAASLNTATAYVGEDVIVTNVASESGAIQGATMRGTVTGLTRAGQGSAAKVRLQFDYLTLANGTTYPIDGVTLSVNAQTKNNTTKEIGGAIGGMLLGNALLKTVFAAAGGGVLGAVGGFLLAKNSHQNMTIPAGSTVAVRVIQARRQAQSAG